MANLYLVGFNLLSANFTKWFNTLKQFVGNLPTKCLSLFDHFVGLALKGLRSASFMQQLGLLEALMMPCL